MILFLRLANGSSCKSTSFDRSRLLEAGTLPLPQIFHEAVPRTID